MYFPMQVAVIERGGGGGGGEGGGRILPLELSRIAFF